MSDSKGWGADNPDWVTKSPSAELPSIDSQEYVDMKIEEECLENQGKEEMRISDVSNYEHSRAYLYEKHTVTITDPWRVFIAPSGSHRVQDMQGTVHYLPHGWHVLSWTPKHIDRPVKF